MVGIVSSFSMEESVSLTKASEKDPGVTLTGDVPQLCQFCQGNAVYTGVRAYTPQGSAWPQLGAASTLTPVPAAPVPLGLAPSVPLQAMPWGGPGSSSATAAPAGLT